MLTISSDLEEWGEDTKLVTVTPGSIRRENSVGIRVFIAWAHLETWSPRDSQRRWEGDTEEESIESTVLVTQNLTQWPPALPPLRGNNAGCTLRWAMSRTTWQ